MLPLSLEGQWRASGFCPEYAFEPQCKDGDSLSVRVGVDEYELHIGHQGYTGFT